MDIINQTAAFNLTKTVKAVWYYDIWCSEIVIDDVIDDIVAFRAHRPGYFVKVWAFPTFLRLGFLHFFAFPSDFLW